MIQVHVYVPLPRDDFYADAIPRISRLKFVLGNAVAYPNASESVLGHDHGDNWRLDNIGSYHLSHSNLQPSILSLCRFFPCPNDQSKGTIFMSVLHSQLCQPSLMHFLRKHAFEIQDRTTKAPHFLWWARYAIITNIEVCSSQL